MTHGHFGDYSEHPQLDLCIILSIMWLFTIPLYIYGFYKWYHFRHHFLISKRFPKITYFLAFMAIQQHILETVIFWLHYNQIHSEFTLFLMATRESFSFAALSIVLYRTFLVYLTWRQLQETLNKMVAPESVKLVIHEEVIEKRESINTITKKYQPTQDKLSYLFIIYIIIGTLFIMFKNFWFHKINRAVWTSVVIIGIILLYIKRKVKEGIGLFLESRIILIAIFSIFALSQFESFNITLAHISHYLQIFSLFLWCLLPLYLTLYNIYKCEGTLDISLQAQLSSLKAKKSNQAVSKHKKPRTPTDDGKTANLDNDKELDIIIDLEQPIELFLEKEENYKLFARYLVYCFAIENLLFLEKVSIFKQIVSELQEKHLGNIEEHESDPESPDSPEIAEQKISDMPPPSSTPNQIRTLSFSVDLDENVIVPRIEFSFLTASYKEYRNIIECNIASKESQMLRDCAYYKCGLDAIIKDIYTNFIMEDSVNQVNIAYDTRAAILSIIDDGLCSLKTWRSYQNLFNDALWEIYQLNVSLYTYRLQQFVNEHGRE